ncbi:DUF3347 domain-containing protein [Pontibacter chitinilyticus]|uniref:DUF3347 domain-containing protein n=1 Tax=Pontibacter chitinilyticus TaxID=2674989 RepID=UPI003218FDF7
MKNKLMGLVLATLSLTACNGANTEQANTDVPAAASPQAEETTADMPATSAILDSYLALKNALAADDGAAAAKAGDAMVSAMGKFDKAALTQEQQGVYDDIIADAREHAEHIGQNADKIEHQREHFEILSKDMYDFVKAFGTSQTLYQDFCPMYNNNKGAFWLSSTKEISNPYLGKSMPACGQVKEEIN